MSISTVSSLTAIGAAKITGAFVWTDDSDGTTVKTPMSLANLASSIVARDANRIAALDGITFPATQSASANANTLDDYEEGSWTPVLTFGGASTGITYTTQLGTYTKIGNVVRTTCYVILSSKGSSTGIARIASYPFSAAASPYSIGVLRLHSLGTPPTAMGLWAVVDVGAATAQLCYLSTAGNETNFTDAHFGNTTGLIITAVYNV